MKKKIYTVICRMVGMILWGTVLAAVVPVAVPMIILKLLTEAVKGRE